MQQHNPILVFLHGKCNKTFAPKPVRTHQDICFARTSIRLIGREMICLKKKGWWKKDIRIKEQYLLTWARLKPPTSLTWGWRSWYIPALFISARAWSSNHSLCCSRWMFSLVLYPDDPKLFLQSDRFWRGKCAWFVRTRSPRAVQVWIFLSGPDNFSSMARWCKFLIHGDIWLVVAESQNQVIFERVWGRGTKFFLRLQQTRWNGESCSIFSKTYHPPPWNCDHDHGQRLALFTILILRYLIQRIVAGFLSCHFFSILTRSGIVLGVTERDRWRNNKLRLWLLSSKWICIGLWWLRWNVLDCATRHCHADDGRLTGFV